MCHDVIRFIMSLPQHRLLSFLLSFVAFAAIFILPLGATGGHESGGGSHHHDHTKLRPCGLYEDTNGRWVDVAQIIASTNVTNSTSSSSSNHSHSKPLYNYKKHFYGGGSHGGMGAALGFTHAWIPDTCSYHRFTNQTLHECAAYSIKKHNLTNGVFHIMFLGDSATRGIICGLSRLLSGSELFGPLDNSICGGPSHGLPVSTSRFGKYISVEFGNIKVTFEYVKDWYTRHLDWMLEWAILQEKPYALIYNSGAWDFDRYARQHNSSDPLSSMNHGCETEEAYNISLKRYAKPVIDGMIELGGYGKQVNTRLIYRNSHFNIRYGAFCADEEYEKRLNGTGWEIWDNRNISHDVWQHQTWDGFHFDRHKVYSETHHKQNRNAYIESNKPLPGCMEMQFVQSLLQSVCHDYLRETFFNHTGYSHNHNHKPQ